MKEFDTNCQLWNKYFLVVVFHFSLVKVSMNAPHLSKLLKHNFTGIAHGAMVLTKRFHFFIFQLPKAEQRPLHTCQLRRG
jgi:hypothetical protein